MVLSPSLLGFVPWEKTRFNATRFGWFLVCILGGSKFGSCLTCCARQFGRSYGGAKRCFRCCRVEKIRALRSFVQGTEALCCCPGLSIAEGGHRPDATFFGARLAEFSVSLQAGPTSHCPLSTSNQAPNGAFSGHHHHEHGSRPNNHNFQHGSEILTDAVLSQTKPPGQG